MPGFDRLKIKEGKSQKLLGIPPSFLPYLIKNNARYLLAGRCQDDFRVGCALCQCDGCKSAKMRVG